MIEYTAPKFNRDGLRQGVITVNPSSRVWLPLADILTATRSETAPVVWKRRLWGTLRDQKFLDMLQSLPSLRDNVDVLSELRFRKAERTKRWVAGQGIKPWPQSKTLLDRDPKPIIWPLDMRFVEATPWISDSLIFEDETISLRDRLKKKRYRSDVLYSQPPPDLFHNPMVLFSQGFGKVSYCDFDVLFQDSLQSIAGPYEDNELLMFLTAYLRSKLARYFLFHTSANWGSERDKVHLNELLRVPFPLPGHEFVSPEAGKIVKQVSQKFGKLRARLQDTLNDLKADANRSSLFDDDVDISKQWQKERKKQIDALQKELEPLIYSYFTLTEQEITLVEDTNDVFEPSSTPTTWNTAKTVTLDPLEKTKIEPYASQSLGAYANTLTNTLNSWAEAEGSGYRVHAEGGTDEQTGLALITVKLASTEAEFQRKPISRNLAKKLKGFHSHASKEQGALLYERDILFFQGRQIHIVRPNILLNWTRTAALNDAARIYGDIALAQENF
jgi:hypothetical protein